MNMSHAHILWFINVGLLESIGIMYDDNYVVAGLGWDEWRSHLDLIQTIRMVYRSKSELSELVEDTVNDIINE